MLYCYSGAARTTTHRLSIASHLHPHTHYTNIQISRPHVLVTTTTPRPPRLSSTFPQIHHPLSAVPFAGVQTCCTPQPKSRMHAFTCTHFRTRVTCTHTHTPTPARALPYRYAFTHMYMYTHTRTRACTRTHTYTHAYIYPHSHTNTQLCTLVCMRACSHARVYAHFHKYVHIDISSDIITHNHSRMRLNVSTPLSRSASNCITTQSHTTT